jgi:ribonuclease HI
VTRANCLHQSPSPESNVSRKRVAPTNRDRRSPTVIKPEDETATLQPHANAVSIAAGDQQPLQSESSSDEDLDDESDDDKSSNDGPLNDNFDEEKSDVDSDDGEEAQKAAFRPRRAAKATALVPQVAPRTIFAHSATNHPHRMIRRDNPKKEILIYTSGQFIGKKKRKPARAGCAVIFESETQVGRPWSVKFPLEQRGPRGFQNDMDQRTAELRALVAALELRLWSTEGWEKVIIATSSIYAHRGITQNVGHWESKGWLRGVLNGDKHLKNFDLWARAIDLVNEHAYRGCEVQFWLIRPEEANDAESAARLAASAGPAPQAYQSMSNIRITWKTS